MENKNIKRWIPLKKFANKYKIGIRRAQRLCENKVIPSIKLTLYTKAGSRKSWHVDIWKLNELIRGKYKIEEVPEDEEVGILTGKEKGYHISSNINMGYGVDFFVKKYDL